jgi:hypothetical protein
LAVLKNPTYHFKRIGLEAGPLSQWPFSAFAEAGLPVICVETRHMKALLKAQINKTDRNDALRSSSGHAPFEEMVMAQGLGDANRQAPRDEKGDCGAGVPVGRDHAPHVDRRHRIPLDPGTGHSSSMKTEPDQIR